MQDCVHSTGCSIRSLWGRLEDAVRGVLQRVTVAELAGQSRVTAIWVDPPGEPAPPSGA
jgi:DNA-binding IscR family transcriptional regulator